jgi:hypothetical protein
LVAKIVLEKTKARQKHAKYILGAFCGSVLAFASGFGRAQWSCTVERFPKNAFLKNNTRFCVCKTRSAPKTPFLYKAE